MSTPLLVKVAARCYLIVMPIVHATYLEGWCDANYKAARQRDVA